jgi:hypothetical protein
MAALDYTALTYNDLMRQARGWGAFGASAPLNQFGYPTSLPNGAVSNLVSINDHGRSSHLPTGQYVLLWDGEGSFSASGSQVGNYQVTSSTASGGRATFNYAGGGDITLTMTTLVRPHASVKLLVPGTESTYQTQPFFEPFLRRLKWCKVIRCMDWLATNANPSVQWSDRLTLNHASQAMEKQRNDGGSIANVQIGTCVELTAQLANILYTDGDLEYIWLNVPAAANDNYVLQMATYFRDNLNSNLKVILEYTNEPWNYAGAFRQGFDLDTIGRSVAPAGLEEWRYRLIGHGHRAPEVMKIWRDTWGAQASRLTCVGNLQVNNSGVNEISMNYMHPTLGRSGNAFDAFATAPYFDGQGLNDIRTNDALDFAKMRAILNRSDTDTLALMRADAERSSSEKIDTDLAWISTNFPGKKLFIYECQQHVIPDIWPDNFDKNGNAVGTFAASARGEAVAYFLRINQSAEIGDIIHDYLTAINQKLQGNPTCFFTYTGPDITAQLSAHQFGFWGSNQLGAAITAGGAVKINAAIRAIGKNPNDYDVAALYPERILLDAIGEPIYDAIGEYIYLN